jgi:hypothetical protein
MCNILDHRKVKMIRKGQEGNTLVLLRLMMLIEAGKCDRGGYLMISGSLPYTAETLSMVTVILRCHVTSRRRTEQARAEEKRQQQTRFDCCCPECHYPESPISRFRLSQPATARNS